MDAQEVFDKVSSHLITQRRQAIGQQPGWKYEDAPDICLYRGPDGTKCAVGCMIPDDDYVMKMENRKASEVIFDFDGLEFLIPHVVLLQELQGVHDQTPTDPQGNFLMDDLFASLNQVASNFGLKQRAV